MKMDENTETCLKKKRDTEVKKKTFLLKIKENIESKTSSHPICTGFRRSLIFPRRLPSLLDVLCPCHTPPLQLGRKMNGVATLEYKFHREHLWCLDCNFRSHY